MVDRYPKPLVKDELIDCRNPDCSVSFRIGLSHCPDCKTDNEPPLQSDEINNPKHYQLFADGIESIDVIASSLTHEEFIGFCKGNVLKYKLRAGEKGDALKCLAKADWYQNRLAEFLK